MIPIPAGNTYNKKEVDSISTQRKPAPEQAKKELAEQLWLSYYNQVLFEAGLITEAERNRMKNKSVHWRRPLPMGLTGTS